MEDVIVFLNENFNEEKVLSMLDDEILNWVDSDWEDDGECDDEYEWYVCYGRNMAEDVIIEEITSNVLECFPDKDETQIHQFVKSYYECLDYFDSSCN